MRVRGGRVPAGMCAAAQRTRRGRGPGAPPGAVRALLGAAAAAVVCALLGLLAPAAVAADPSDAPSASLRTAYLAERLREHPVYLSDQMPREVPRSARPQYARLAKRTGVPTYVLVMPWQSQGKALLAGVHEELGRDGLYVLLNDVGIDATATFGVTVPHKAAATVALYEVPHDAGPQAVFERFVEVVREPPEKAKAMADAAQEEEDSGPAFISLTDRRNQSFVTGVALTGVPLLLLLLGPLVRRHRARLRALRAPAPTPSGHPPAPPAAAPPAKADRALPRPRPNRWELLAAAVAAGLVLLGATTAFDQTRSSAAPVPTAADLNARVERVAHGLTKDPVYVDPESPQPLTAKQLARLRDRMADTLDGRLFLAVVPSLTDDETAGDDELLLHRLQREVRKDGVYILADPYGGNIRAVNFGLRLDLKPYLLPDRISRPAIGDDSLDKNLAQRLDALLTYLSGLPPTPASQPAPSPHPPSPAPTPSPADRELPSLFATDFWPGALFVGPSAAVLLAGLVAAVLAGWRGGLRRRLVGPVSPGEGAAGYPAPSAPSLAWLRRTARRELHVLGRAFDTLAPPDGPLRSWAYDCLDAATLLADQDGDGRVDPDAEPGSLAAVITLTRCARAALGAWPTAASHLRPTVRDCCGLNPLHGPAVSTTGGFPRCARCAQLTATSPTAAQQLALTLPAPGGGRLPYQEAAGPLPAVRHGLAALMREIKENAGVR